MENTVKIFFLPAAESLIKLTGAEVDQLADVAQFSLKTVVSVSIHINADNCNVDKTSRSVRSGVYEPELPKNLHIVWAFVVRKEVLVRNKAFLAVEIFVMSLVRVSPVVYCGK